MAARSSIELEADPRSIVGTRVYDAPRALVFSAFTNPEHLAQWWGPDGFTTTTSAFEFRPGGTWRFVMHGPHGRDYQNRVTFIEIVESARLIYRHAGGDDVEPVQFEQTLTFADYENGKTLLTWHGRFPTAAERARVIRDYGADKGLAETMARLADFIAAQKTRAA